MTQWEFCGDNSKLLGNSLEAQTTFCDVIVLCSLESTSSVAAHQYDLMRRLDWLGSLFSLKRNTRSGLFLFRQERANRNKILLIIHIRAGSYWLERDRCKLGNVEEKDTLEEGDSSSSTLPFLPLHEERAQNPNRSLEDTKSISQPSTLY
mmetsp:Transcript_9032/g.39810  ORF Transcript_9032/g.39810 Transcript_9032/m.39810 type:complete len:150 (-) Transcript_9032:1517-1966(-)